MSDPKIIKEVAEQEFDRFIEAMDIEADPLEMDDEDKEQFKKQKSLVVARIMAGNVIIDDAGQPVYTVKQGDGDPITFYEPTGASLMAMDRKKKAEDIGKLYATMADMTKQPIKRFAGMKYRDLKVCIAITSLFLG